MAGGREGLSSSSSFPGTWVRSNPALIWLVWICALLLGWRQAQPISCQHPNSDKCFPITDSEKQRRRRQDPQTGTRVKVGQLWVIGTVSLMLAPLLLNHRYLELVLLCVCRNTAAQPNLIGNGRHRLPPASGLCTAGEIPPDPFFWREYQTNFSSRLCRGHGGKTGRGSWSLDLWCEERMDMHPANAWYRMARSSGTQESSWAVTLEEKRNRPSRIDSLKVSADHAPAQDKRVGSGVWLLWISCCREE